VPLKTFFLVTTMFAFAAVVSHYIDWQHRLAVTHAATLHPPRAIAIVASTEVAWFAVNVYTFLTLNKTWKTPAGGMRQFLGLITCLSFLAQVYLGFFAIRAIRAFMREIPGSW